MAAQLDLVVRMSSFRAKLPQLDRPRRHTHSRPQPSVDKPTSRYWSHILGSPSQQMLQPQQPPSHWLLRLIHKRESIHLWPCIWYSTITQQWCLQIPLFRLQSLMAAQLDLVVRISSFRAKLPQLDRLRRPTHSPPQPSVDKLTSQYLRHTLGSPWQLMLQLQLLPLHLLQRLTHRREFIRLWPCKWY